MAQSDNSTTVSGVLAQNTGVLTDINGIQSPQETFHTPSTGGGHHPVTTCTTSGMAPVLSVVSSQTASTSSSTMPVYAVSTPAHRAPATTAPTTTQTLATIAATIATTTMVNSQVGTFIPTNTAVAGMGQNSQPAMHSYTPTWATSTTTSTRPVQHGWQTGQPHGNIDFNAMAQQLNAMQAQLASMQTVQNNYMANMSSVHNQGGAPYQQLAPPAPPSWNNQWTGSVVCSVPQQAHHTFNVQPTGGACVQDNHLVSILWQHGQNGPVQEVSHTSYRHIADDRLLVSQLKPVDSLGDYMRMAPFEGIPDRTMRNAISGTFVDIEHFLKPVTSVLDSNSDIQTVMDPITGHVSYKLKKQSKDIDNIFTWLEAFLNYQ